MRTPRWLALAAILAVTPTALAACGDDDDNTTKVATGGKAAVVPAVTRLPRYAGLETATKQPTPAAVGEFEQLPKQTGGTVAPRVRGSDVPLEQFIDTVSNDVATYWQRVFNNSGYKFPETTQAIVTGTVSGPCGEIETDAGPPVYCRQNTTLYLPLGYFRSKVAPLGDAAPVTMVALLWGYRAQDAVGAFRAVEQGNLRGVDVNLGAICMAGSYMATVAKRQLLEQGDATEVLALVRATADRGQPESVANAKGSPAQREAAFRIGFSRGSSTCQKVRAS